MQTSNWTEPMPSGLSAARASSIGKPLRVEWVIAVFAALVQESAFIFIPAYFGHPVTMGLAARQDQNLFNTFAVGLSTVFIFGLALININRFIELFSNNKMTILFIVFAFISLAWSTHPDLTLRRGVGLVLTTFFAAYLVVRFDELERMQVLSYSFAIAAIGSLLFVIVFPGDGIMKFKELTGDWRGIFIHKNSLAATMAAAVFVEMIILTKLGVSRGRLALLALYVFLAIVARSATALVITMIYLLFGYLYNYGKATNARLATALIVCMAMLYAGIAMVLIAPEMAFALLGKDPTLTGRTAVWEVVRQLIKDRPLLGYGYHAMWATDDPITIVADRAVGGWGLTGSHNAFLEITLQLGYVGLGFILILMAIAFVRAFKCWRRRPGPLGYFTMVYLVAALLAAQAMEFLGGSQTIEWTIFNLLLFSCGAALQPVRRIQKQSSASVDR